MHTIQLTESNGRLYFPMGGSDAMNGEWDCPELPSLLIHRYAAGDADTCPWPMVAGDYQTVEGMRYILAAALYDERESNECWPRGSVTILLPDGEPFDLDAVLAESEDDTYQGHQREYNPDNFRGI